MQELRLRLIAELGGVPIGFLQVIGPLANKRVHRFYERLGFRFEGERWFDPDRCFVHRLERAEAVARGLLAP